MTVVRELLERSITMTLKCQSDLIIILKKIIIIVKNERIKKKNKFIGHSPMGFPCQRPETLG